MSKLHVVIAFLLRLNHQHLLDIDQYFNQRNKCRFSHQVFSTNPKGEEVHNPNTVNYFNSLYTILDGRQQHTFINDDRRAPDINWFATT